MKLLIVFIYNDDHIYIYIYIYSYIHTAIDGILKPVWKYYNDQTYLSASWGSD